MRVLIFLLISTPLLARVSGNICQGQDNGHFLNNPAACHAYFVCMDENAIPGECNPNFNFNEELQICDLPENYPCPYTNCTDVTVDNIAHPFSCVDYFLCFDGQTVERNCTDGLEFNEITGRCDFPQNANCYRGKCPVLNDPDNIVFLESKSNCSEYFICHNGFPSPRQCSPGLNFNINTTKCDFPENTICLLDVDEDIPGTPTPPGYTEEPSTTEEPTTIPPLTFDCPDYKLSAFPHQEDCNKFWVCSSGKSHLFNCAPQLHFDPINLHCDTQENANCELN